MQRNQAIDVAKGIAIILVVIGHAEMPGMLNRAIYLFHMPLFFITAGYFFTPRTAESPWTFIGKRFRGLYVPCVKWSLFFLLIHNLLHRIGILNETYGNWTGGVTHPYSWHQFWQRVVNIVFSMSGYDEFLAGAFWFFRGLLVASISFLVAYLLLSRFRRLKEHPTRIAALIALGALAFAAFKVGEGVRISTLPQGGYRDIMGTFFFALGFLYRRFEPRLGHSVWAALMGAGFVLVGAWAECKGMSLQVELKDVFTLAVTGTAGWFMTYNASCALTRHTPRLASALGRIGVLSLYIFIWHVSAYKVVSLIKIWWYGLDWRQIGCHMVVHEYADKDLFWALYSIAGVGIPIAGYYIYKWCATKLNNLKPLPIWKRKL